MKVGKGNQSSHWTNNCRGGGERYGGIKVKLTQQD